MLLKVLANTTAIGAVVASCFLFAGCRQPGACHNGSCPAPSGGYSSAGYGATQSYAQPSYQGSGSVNAAPSYSAPAQSYSAPAYSAPSGSGSRPMPSSGSGSR